MYTNRNVKQLHDVVYMYVMPVKDLIGPALSIKPPVSPRHLLSYFGHNPLLVSMSCDKYYTNELPNCQSDDDCLHILHMYMYM